MLACAQHLVAGPMGMLQCTHSASRHRADSPVIVSGEYFVARPNNRANPLLFCYQAYEGQYRQLCYGDRWGVIH